MTAGAIAPAAERLWTTGHGRRVSAGLSPPPGTHAKLPSWWGRQHWLDVDVSCALAQHRDWAREEHVEPDTALRVARAHARYADGATGRNCRPTNERLAADLKLSVRQLQRARRLLIRCGLVEVVVAGRSFMTRSERLHAWRNGSSHRQIAAEFALCSPRHPHPGRCSVERVTPPREARVYPSTHRKCGSSPKNRPKDERLRRTQHKVRGPRAVSPAQLRSRRLAAGVQRRLGWLRATSPRRLTSLHRFAQQGWTPLDVHRALDQVLKARGWSVPREVKQPAAYLATLLRDVDPADRPGALEEAMLAEELARREQLWQLTFGNLPQCPHGEPAGDQPHPTTGRIRCPLCRKAQS